MKSFFWLFLIWSLLIPKGLEAQNLIPNPSFESFLNCPAGPAQIYLATGWSGIKGHGGSADYFNSCKPRSPNSVEVPFNAFGFQYPYSGNAYVGLTLFVSNTMFREYIVAKLNAPLEPGYQYRISFNYSISDYSDFTVAGLGIYLGQNEPVASGGNGLLPVIAQLKVDTLLDIDTSSWHNVTFLYNANGGEQYIVIGNFNNNFYSYAYRWKHSNQRGFPEACYVYIDDVKVEKYLYVMGDTSLCEGDTTVLFASLPVNGWALKSNPENILSKDSIFKLTPVSSGSYFLYGKEDTIEFEITVRPKPKINLGSDTLICSGKPIIIQPFGASFINYLWQDNSNNSFYKASDSGCYFVKVFDGYCYNSDTINLYKENEFTVNLGPDTSGCAGDVKLLDAGYTDATCKWQDNTTTRTYLATQSDTYAVVVSRPGFLCPVTDSVKITFYPKPSVDLGIDKTICSGDSLLFDLRSRGYSGVLWQDGSKDSLYKVKSAGTYLVFVKDKFCFDFDTVEVKLHKVPSSGLSDRYLICEGDSLIISFPTFVTNVTWMDGNTNLKRTIKTGHNYVFIYSDSMCSDRDSLLVNIQHPPHFNFPDDTSMCKGEQLILNPGVADAYYLWQDGTTLSTYEVKEWGTYFVTVKNQCGQKTDSVNVSDCTCQFYVPTAFTPNEDVLNEGFRPEGCAPEFYHLMIFTRWGQLIFETNDYREYWRGDFDGKPVADNVFVWVIEYSGSTKTKKATKISRGTVTLLR